MKDLRIVLVAPRNPLNIGAAARAISNFGFTHLRLVNPYNVAYHEAKSAVNASAILKSSQEYATVSEAVADCTLVVGTTAVGHRILKHPLRRIEYGARLMRKSPGPIALLFGSEKFGLGNDDMSHCHWLVRIPTREEHGSMNLGQAVAICLYELSRDSKAAVKESTASRPASAEEVERFTSYLLEALSECGYLKPLTSTSMVEKTRRMIRRLNLSAADSVLCQGMLRQILWKLRNPGE
jgi:TrmH family RNA methyltransferase